MERKRLRAERTPAPPKREDQDAAKASVARQILVRAHPSVAALAHVDQDISAFLDSSKKWTLESASKAGFVLLSDRLAANEWPDVCYDFREARFLYNIEVAARAGDTDVLNWWRTKYLPNGPDVAGAIIRIAAYKGHLHVLKWLYQADGHVRSIGRMKTPLICVFPEIVHWVREHRRHVELDVWLEEAAYRGDLEFIKWVKTQKLSYEIYEATYNSAAYGGHLEVLQHLMKEQPTEYLDEIYGNAAEKGHKRVIEWMFSVRPELETYTLFDWEMEENFDFSIIEWFVEQHKWLSADNKNEWIRRFSSTAAIFGHLKILQYFDKHKPLTGKNKLLDLGIFSGSIETVQWLHDRGVGCEDDIMLASVESQNLELVKWVHDNYPNQPASTKPMDYAAHEGLDFVKWFHENRSEGCTTEAMDDAASRGNLDVVKFLHENRSEGCTALAMLNAAKNGHLEVVKFLRANRSEGGAASAFVAAASHGHLKVVQWLYGDCAGECDAKKAFYRAAFNGHRHVVTFLAPHCEPNYDRLSVGEAVRYGRFDMLEWILQHREKPLAHHEKYYFQERRSLLSPSYCPRDLEDDHDEELFL